MKDADKDQIITYLQTQLRESSSRLLEYTVDSSGKEFKRRSMALIIDKYINNFKLKGSEPRWVAISGLRGVGKTTILAQIFINLKCDKDHKLYISLDESKNILNADLWQLLQVYEELLGCSFESLKSEVYIFIDEVHYDPSWNIVLKTIYDKSKKVFIICTGSSALSLQQNPDVSRRMVLEKLYPTSFVEYQMLKKSKLPIKELGLSVKKALFESDNAEEVYNKLSLLTQKVNQYWIDVDKLDMDRYLNYGTIPFTLNFKDNDVVIYQQLMQTLNNIIYKDIAILNKFDQYTVSQMIQIIYVIASQDVTSVRKLAQIFNMSQITLTEILDTLTKCDVLLKVYPYGTHIGQVKKPLKYLFVSSAYRSTFFNIVGSTQVFNYYKGKLLEDVVGLYISRIFHNDIITSVSYDSSVKGADFIVKINDKIIPIEVGYGNKDYHQVEQTLSTTKGIYGISVSPAGLLLNSTKTSILVPLKYFLLM